MRRKKNIHPTSCSLRTHYNGERCRSLDTQSHITAKVSPLKLGSSLFPLSYIWEKMSQKKLYPQLPFILRGQNKQQNQVRKRLTTPAQTQGKSECGVLDLLSSEIFSSVTAYAACCSAQQQRRLRKQMTKQGTAAYLQLSFTEKYILFIITFKKTPT